MSDVKDRAPDDATNFEVAYDTGRGIETVEFDTESQASEFYNTKDKPIRITKIVRTIVRGF
jgi:hypothetical protein